MLKEEDTPIEDTSGNFFIYIYIYTVDERVTRLFFVDHSETFVKIVQRIPHDGEVNRARYHNENTNIIATKSRSGEVYVFDRTTFDSLPRDEFNPTLKLVGHDKEG